MGPVEQISLGSRAAERPVSERDDGALVQATREGDDRAFEELYERYRSRIAAFVSSMVRDHQRTEDVTQEVFLSALRRLRQTRAPIAFKPWLYEIARNACIDQHRRLKRSREVPLEEELADVARHANHSPSPHAALNAKEQIDDLCDAFSGLTHTQHEMLVMREFEGRSYRDIGERLNLTKPAVESALFRARRRLMQEYQELTNGVRCARVQRAIRGIPVGPEPVRDWRIALHLSRCRSCRAHARLRGVRFVGTPPRRVAALLPLPALLPRSAAGGWRARLSGIWSGRSEWVARWSLAGCSDTTVPGLVTAGVAAATVALALGSASVLGAHVTRSAGPAMPATAVWPASLGQPWSDLPLAQVANRTGGAAGTAGHLRRGRTSARVRQTTATRSAMRAVGAAGDSASIVGLVSARSERRHSGGGWAIGGPASNVTGTLGLSALEAPSTALPPVGAPATHLPSVGQGTSGGSPSSGAPPLPATPTVGSPSTSGAASNSAAGPLVTVGLPVARSSG